MAEDLHLSPITRQGKKTPQFVFEALCGSILEGQLKPGQRVREVELAEALAVSRTPVREALRQLELQHLLRHNTNGAYFVSEWDPKSLWELATLRGALEGLAISLAVNNFNQEDDLALETLIDGMTRSVQHKDYDKLIQLDIEFHKYIWSRSGHTFLEEMLEQLNPQIHYFMGITMRGDDEEIYPATHRELLELLRQRDPIRAKEAVQKHILETAQHLTAELSNS